MYITAISRMEILNHFSVTAKIHQLKLKFKGFFVILPLGKKNVTQIAPEFQSQNET